MRKLLLGLVLMAMPAVAQPAPDVEHNKAVVRGFFTEVLDQGHLEHYADSHAANFIAHGNHDFSLAEDLAIATDERHAAPDLHMQVLQLLGEGDMVAVYWKISGTNTGDGMGIKATGKPFSTVGSTFMRLKDGKIVEEWNAWSYLSILQQVGVLPAK
jgi:predicted ester cyclase